MTSLEIDFLNLTGNLLKISKRIKDDFTNINYAICRHWDRFGGP